MEADVHIKARIAILTSEMEAIHSANILYWGLSKEATLKARSEHEGRKKRLEEIRNELAHLLNSASRHKASIDGILQFE